MMKKILITGKDSYIGTNFENCIKLNNADYIVDTISVQDDSWITKCFSQYDSIL